MITSLALRKAPPPLPRREVESDIDVSLDEPPTEMVEIAPAIEDELVAVCARELELESARPAVDATRIARLHFEMARALRDDEAALEHYQQALARVPDHLPSIRGARTLLLGKRRHAEALPLFDAEVRLFDDARDKARLLFGKGRALEDLAGDRASARECYRRAAELDANTPAYVAALAQVEQSDRDWAALAGVQEHAANAVQNDERQRAAILVQRARLLDTRLGESAKATELYEQALALDDAVAGARGALERLLHEQGRWRELMVVLERKVAESGDPAVQLGALLDLATLHRERLGNRAEAIAALARAMHVAPRDPLVLDTLVHLYEEAGQPRNIANVLAHRVETIVDPRARLGLLHRIGHIHEKELADDEAATRWYESALRIDAAYRPALDALDRLYERTKSWESLIVVHMAAIEALRDANARAASHARIAEIFEMRVGRPDEAIRHHAHALALAPKTEGSFKALARLYADARRFRELVELYERGIDNCAEDSVAIALLFEIGALYETQLGEPEEAMHAYRRVLERQPAHLGAIQALGRAAESAGRHREVVEALELEAELAGDRARRVALLHKAGDVLADRLGDREAAVQRLRVVLDLDRTHVPAATSLARLYHALGRYEDLLDVLRLELELTESKSAKVELWYKLGELRQHRLADDTQAIAAYRHAIELDATHAPSLRALTHMLERAGDYEGLCQTLQAELDAAREPGDKARIAYRLGELYEVHLDRADKAEAAYAKAIDAAPSFRPARMALARVEGRAQSWLHVADALMREAEQSIDPRTAIELLLRAAQIWNDLLAQPEQATGCYEQVLALDDKNQAALDELEGLYRQAGAWEALADVHARQAAVRRDPRARIAALEELARVQQNVATPSERVRTYQAILALDGAHAGALEGLERLARLLGDYTLLADIDARAARAQRQASLAAMHQTRLGRALESSNPEMAIAAFRSALVGDPESLAAIRGLGRAAERLGDHAGVVDALRREAQWTRDDRRGGKLLVCASRLCLERLGDPVGALVDAERALERHPDSEEAARLLRELLREDSERLLTVLSRAAGGARDPGRIGDLWRDIARLYANERNDVPAALSALAHVLEDQKDAATMQLYGELLIKSRQYHEGAEAFRQALMLGPSREQAAQLYMTLARLYVDRFGDMRGASEALESLLRFDRRHREALTLLLDLYGKAGDETGRRRTLTRMLDDARAPSETTWTLLELGRLDLHTGRTQDAALALRRAVAIEGALGEAATLYKQILGTNEPWDYYAEALQEHIARVQRGEIEDARLRETYLALASTQHEVLLQTDRALRTLREAMVAYPRDLGIHLELADRLSATGRLDEAIVEYRNIVSSDPTRVEGWRGMARALHEGGRKLEAAVALAPVAVLGAATTIEAGMARQRRANPGRATPGSFGSDVLEKVSAGERPDEGRIIGVLGVLGEALPKLYPLDLERYSATSRDRLGDHPLKKQVLELAAAFGVTEIDVYLHRAPLPDVVAEVTQPPALMVPQLVADSKEAERVFSLARPLSLVARGLHPALALGGRELGRLLAAAMQTMAPGYGHDRYPVDELRELNKRLQKALSRRGRRSLEPAVQLYLEDPPVDFERWMASVPLSSTRAAALLANDLPAAVQAIRRASAEHARLDGAPLVQHSPVVADLLRFWTSDLAFEVRRSAGIL